MKNLKIVIKCEGLFVRTKDLKMGQSILNRMSDHGIMKETTISCALLDKANEMFDVAANRISKLREENARLRKELKIRGSLRFHQDAASLQKI